VDVFAIEGGKRERGKKKKSSRFSQGKPRRGRKKTGFFRGKKKEERMDVLLLCLLTLQKEKKEKGKRGNAEIEFRIVRFRRDGGKDEEKRKGRPRHNYTIPRARRWKERKKRRKALP